MKRPTMMLQWFGDDMSSYLYFGGECVADIMRASDDRYCGNVSADGEWVMVCSGKSLAAAKRAVCAHVLAEMEREVMRAKKARRK